MSKRWIMTSVIAGITVTSAAHGDVWELNVGNFLFGNGTTGYEYQGDHAAVLGSDIEGDPIEKTVATVDLGALMASQSAHSIAWIRISDPGCNSYTTNPGADIDLFSVSGLPEGLGLGEALLDMGVGCVSDDVPDGELERPEEVFGL